MDGAVADHVTLPLCCAVQPNERFKDLLIIENVVTLNSAFCRRHLGYCPPSAQLASECAQVRSGWS